VESEGAQDNVRDPWSDEPGHGGNVLIFPYDDPMTQFLDRARALPKVVLHDHLDGGLRPATLFELLQARNLPCPAPDVAALEAWFDDRAHAGSLEEYLQGFALTVAAMATPQALERVALEAGIDAHADGVELAEFRIAPLLFEPHGVAPEAAIEALLAGLKKAPIPCGLIVCAMRDLPQSETQRAVELALRYRHYGVVGFDLAGAELGHPASDHARALRRVCDAGLGLTLHAGEADSAQRVAEAVRMGARRIGHGVRLVDALVTQYALVEEVLRAGVHLEICPTSNVHTGAAPSIAEHPITKLWRAGISLSYQTDNRLMSRTSMSQEAALLLEHTPLTEDDLRRMTDEARRHRFLQLP
jgi:adenosine deaminase